MKLKEAEEQARKENLSKGTYWIAVGDGEGIYLYKYAKLNFDGTSWDNYDTFVYYMREFYTGNKPHYKAIREFTV